jgi:hypothetical protein
MRFRPSSECMVGDRRMPVTHHRDHGMVTAEVALAIMSLSFVLLGCLAGVGELAVRIRALDAAQVAARLAARGEPGSVVTAAARAHAPAGSRVLTSTSASGVRVTVTAPGVSLGVFRLPAVHVEAVGPVEQ